MAEESDASRFFSVFFRFHDYIRLYKCKYGESGKTFMVLNKLREYERLRKKPITVSEISRMSGLAMPNVSRLLKPFEEENLIKRVKHGRTVSVEITDSGEKLLAAQYADYEKAVTAALRVLTAEEFENYILCSEKILAALHKKITDCSGE